MNRARPYVIATTVLAILALSSISVADETAQYKSGINRTVHQAVSISVKDLPFEKDVQTLKPNRIIRKHPRPGPPSEEYLESLQREANLKGGTIVRTDPAGNDGYPNRPPGVVTPCNDYLGISTTGWNPPDPHAAVGTDHVVAVVNSSIAFFDKEYGDLLFQTSANSFFSSVNPPSTFIFDPKVIYDKWEDRFVILFLCTNDVDKSSYLVAASKTGDPTGEWWLYDLDAAMNGTEPVNHWPDYPGLGFDATDAVYITSNQWDFTAGFAYSKIRILNKTELYDGSLTGWNDLWDMRYHDNDVVFTIKPAFTLSNDAGGEYLLSNIWYGAPYTTFWKLTDPNSESPVLTLEPQVDLVVPYTFPPNPEQANTSTRLEPLGPMTQEVFYRHGKLYTAFSQGYNFGERNVAALRILGIDTGTAEPFLDEIYGLEDKHYYFPAIATDYQDKVFIGFSRSAANEYVSIRYVENYLLDQTSHSLRTGFGSFGEGTSARWGDYGSISVDPDDRSVWIFHEWPTASHNWSTWIGNVPGSPRQTTLISPADAYTDSNKVVTFEWENVGEADSFIVQIDTDALFSAPDYEFKVTGPTFTDSFFVAGTYYYWRVATLNHCGESAFSDHRSFRLCDPMHGNADGQGGIDIDDIVYLINFVFAGGTPPNPYYMGDNNCDDEVDIDDVVYLITFIFNGGPEPCNNC